MKSVSLVILAGGQGDRMGKHLSSISKCILPVYTTSLLLRQINQAVQVGYSQIIVSTSEVLYPQLSKLLVGEESVHIVSNSQHKFGSLSALYKVLKEGKNERVAMSLADIYFLENPFLAVSKYIDSDDIYLFASRPFDKQELTRGGIIWKDKRDRVKRIYEPAIFNNRSGYRWTGLALFNTSLKSKLKEFLEKNVCATEEDFFSYLIESGQVVRVKIAPDFLNVNTPKHLFLASLYQTTFMEAINDSSLYESLLGVATELRKKIL